ncbi:MAG: hypothetical protein U0411_13985 [Thermodesulfovibrionales bacterium]
MHNAAGSCITTGRLQSASFFARYADIAATLRKQFGINYERIPGEMVSLDGLP